ncbi:MAG: hypothetical protein BM556_12080 [Bacteriovorax sp. MedPE-SWde]|nr:MAG: hypothetical protein BM556_12080 [Bacteriovorax sp. MedPE-SWde]
MRHNAIKTFILLLTIVIPIGITNASYYSLDTVTLKEARGQTNGLYGCNVFSSSGRGLKEESKGKLCSATLLSQTQVVFTPGCRRRISRSRTGRSLKLICMSGAVEVNLPPTERTNYIKALNYIKLRRPLPIHSPKLQLDKKKISDYKSCELITPIRKIKLNRPISIRLHKLKTSEIGSHINCDGIIIGIADSKKSFTLLSSHPSLKDTIDRNIYISEDRDEENIEQTCSKTENCIKALDSKVEDLTSDMLLILEKLNEDFKDLSKTKVTTQEALTELKSDFTDIKYTCQKIDNQSKQLKDDQIDTDWKDSVMGSVESGAISTMDTISSALKLASSKSDYNFLLNQFKDVDILKENLSDKEFKDLYKKVERLNPDISNLDRIKKLTQTYADGAIQNIAKDFDLQRNSDQSYNELTKDLMKEFNKCLTKSKSKSNVMTCADKLSLSSAVKISSIELENQLKENFISRFTDQEYLDIKREVDKTYVNCINQYFYNEERNKDINSSDKAKACVYEAVLVAYEFTKEKELNEVLDSMFSKSEKEVILKEVHKESRNCNLGSVINSANKLKNQDYRTLALLPVNDFKTSLFSCVEKLSVKAGEYVVEKSIVQNPQVVENIKDPLLISLMAKKAVVRDYKDCLDAQPEGANKDPESCRDLITTMTTLDVAAEVMKDNIAEIYTTSKESNKKDQTIQKTNKVINECKNQIREKALENLRSGNSSKSTEKETVNCLSTAVLEIVDSTTQDKIIESLKENEIASKYLNEVLELEEIKALKKETKQCFKKKLMQISTVEEFTSSTDKIQKQCIFETERLATSAISLLAIDKELQAHLPNKKERQALVSNYNLGPKGLYQRISQAKTKKELDSIVSKIQPELTIKVASKLIPNLVKEYLEEYSRKEQNETSNYLIGTLRKCITRMQKKYPSTKYETELTKCTNETTGHGYSEIAKKIIDQNIDSTLSGFPKAAQRVKKQSAARVKNCLNLIPTTLTDKKFKQRSERCLSNEIFNLSYSLPREALGQYRILTGDKLGARELESSLRSVEKYFLLEGKYPKGINSPSVKIHMSTMKCLTSKKRALLKTGKYNIDNAQKEFTKCTDLIESKVKNQVATNFSDHFSAGDREHDTMKKLGFVLTNLTGTNNTEDSDTNIGDTARLLYTVGDKVKTTCNYNFGGCKKAINESKALIDKYKKKNPNATSKELANKFIDSPIMTNVIKAELALTLRVELTNGLSEHSDKQGIMAKVLKDITSSEMIDTLMRTPHGKKVLDIVRDEIKNDRIGAIAENPELKKELAKAIVYDIGNNSFVDKLMYGLVQPTLNQEKKSSNGIFGIFKNFKVSMGRALRIVKGRHFKWDKIRNTKEGKRAREIFAKNLFSPIIQGEDLEKKPSTHKKSKNYLEQQSTQIEELIIKGLKAL